MRVVSLHVLAMVIGCILVRLYVSTAFSLTGAGEDSYRNNEFTNTSFM